MAYGVEQDRLRAVLPYGYESLCPVLRINAEIRNDTTGYVEFNTAVEKEGNKGWLNIGYWNGVPFERQWKKVIFKTDKEFCDCEFKWKFTGQNAHGISIGKTLPAYSEEIRTAYPKQKFTVENAANIPCKQVLGTYKVVFDRETID